jgi:hypothetical protein
VWAWNSCKFSWRRLSLRLIEKLQLQVATGILKETSCVSNPHFLTDDVKTFHAQNSSPTTWKLTWVSSPKFLTDDIKIYMSFKPKLPHENWDELHTQTTSPTTWKLHQLQAQTSSWKLRWVSCLNFSPTTWKLTSASSWNFLMKT